MHMKMSMIRRMLITSSRALAPSLRAAAAASVRSYSTMDLPSFRSSSVSSSHPISFLQTRELCSSVPENGATVTNETAMNVQNTILLMMDNGQPGKSLDAVLAAADQPLSERWEEMITIFLRTQAYAIMPFGFTSDQAGLAAYTQSLHTLMMAEEETQEEVRALGGQIWKVMLTRAFAVEAGPPLDIETARAIVTKVSFLLQSTEFLDRVRTETAVAVDGLSSSATKDETFMAKRKVLQRMLPEAFIEVIVDFDYIGETGYIQMQASLFDHMMDQTISSNMAAASAQVMHAAGVSDAPQQ